MPDKRFIIHLGGAPRSLFSVVERGDETQLGLKSPFTIGRRGSAPLDMEPYDPSMIAEQRFSIHASLCSEKGASAIKQSTRLHNGEKICRRHYTKSIKSGENFAFIYFRRCGS